MGVTLLMAFMLSGCMATYNGVTLNDEKLSSIKRVAIVSLVGDTIAYADDSLFSRQLAQLDLVDANFDQLLAQRTANAFESVMHVEAVVPQIDHAAMSQIYSDSYILNADRFDWEKVASNVRDIAFKNRADVVALILKEEFAVDNPPFLMKGLGVYDFKRKIYLSQQPVRCTAFAHLTLTLLDGRTAKPIAGANFYLQDSLQSKVVIPLRTPISQSICEQSLGNMTADQLNELKKTFQLLTGNRVVQNTVSRLYSSQH